MAGEDRDGSTYRSCLFHIARLTLDYSRKRSGVQCYKPKRCRDGRSLHARSLRTAKRDHRRRRHESIRITRLVIANTSKLAVVKARVRKVAAVALPNRSAFAETLLAVVTTVYD